MSEIPSRYNPQETEDRWYKFWEKHGYFSARPNPAKKSFSIVIPPPNITGVLHMGHALNNTIQDILIRYHRMKGQESLWMPGTDHAGIATQNVVEKAIAKEGLKRQDLGREKFIQRVWQWKEQYGSTIIRQLKKLGASCDWNRERFTMDEEYSQAVLEIFVRLYEKRLIYRGSYIINWCPRCATALSDEEAPHQEIEGNLYYIKYPLKDVGQPLDFARDGSRDGELVEPLASWPVGQLKPANRQTGKPANFIVVATTRPETMLGDTAVAVNPKDKRYKHLIGKTLILPLVNREIKIIADSMVDMKFGTGAVKVTPAHDPNDYALGKKHGLEFVQVMHPDGRMNELAGEYKDMDRFQARQAILEDLKEKGLLEKIQPHQLSAGHCYRCQTIIEPYLSKQWFVKMKPLAKPAIEAVKNGKIKFHPERWKKVYLNWMENIQDWCISRQIWWGHRLPVYYCKNCVSHIANRISSQDDKRYATSDKQKGVIVSRVKPDKCPTCGSTDIYQDEDVLDTWFSSWLWPFATFYWPIPPRPGLSASLYSISRPGLGEDLKYFYPTSVLVTAPEIIFFWVARMIMAGLEFMRDIPFRDVYIHGTVRDIEGKKMSKSLGNIIDPLEIINEYGADALRFSLIAITAQGQDVFLSQERFEQGRNFANKIWNASRFILMNLEPANIKLDFSKFFKKEDLDAVNRWILSRFYANLKEVGKSLDKFRFNEAANLIYGFFWHEFCDWYLEMIKPEIQKPQYQAVMYEILEKLLLVMHPFMPFISEEIWQKIQERGKNSIMLQPWPRIEEELIDKKIEARMNIVFGVITAIRNIRQELGLPLQQAIPAVISSSSRENLKLMETMRPQIKNLARLLELEIQDEYRQIKSSITFVAGDIHVVIPLEGVVDIEKEKAKIAARLEKAALEIKAKEKVLGNKEFIKKAPEEIVEKEKKRLKELKETLIKLKAVKDGLQ